MSRFFIALPILALIASGCDNDHHSQGLIQSSLESKPSVAIVPVVDSTKNNYDWSLSDEFSSELYYRISQKNRIAISDVYQVRKKVNHLGEKNNPFGEDISWVKNA